MNVASCILILEVLTSLEGSYKQLTPPTSCGIKVIFVGRSDLYHPGHFSSSSPLNEEARRTHTRCFVEYPEIGTEEKISRKNK